MAGIVLSIDIAGVIQLQIAVGNLQVIRMEQLYGFACLLLLYLAMLASPLTKVFPALPFRAAYLHARRAIGVLAFYYALLHVLISFFGQLGGFAGLGHFDGTYEVSFLLGSFALAVLLVMAATSLDWAVKTMGFHHWKLLHRLVYFASVAIIVHVALIGPHYMQLSLLGIVTYVAIALLIGLEVARIYLSAHRRGRH